MLSDLSARTRAFASLIFFRRSFECQPMMFSHLCFLIFLDSTRRDLRRSSRWLVSSWRNFLRAWSTLILDSWFCRALSNASCRRILSSAAMRCASSCLCWVAAAAAARSSALAAREAAMAAASTAATWAEVTCPFLWSTVSDPMSCRSRFNNEWSRMWFARQPSRDMSCPSLNKDARMRRCRSTNPRPFFSMRARMRTSSGIGWRLKSSGCWSSFFREASRWLLAWVCGVWICRPA
mmetsp:Transcript_3100/g.7588  ORF Transcript_3100/g.7588 Transcript_3100/m.7588 type:complete len:236 (-) Transcript_3100:660-1367(-)